MATEMKDKPTVLWRKRCKREKNRNSQIETEKPWGKNHYEKSLLISTLFQMRPIPWMYNCSQNRLSFLVIQLPSKIRDAMGSNIKTQAQADTYSKLPSKPCVNLWCDNDENKIDHSSSNGRYEWCVFTQSVVVLLVHSYANGQAI